MAKRNVINGKDLMVFVSSKALALATDCKISVAATTEEAANKDMAGWSNPEIVGWEWDGTSNNLCGANAESPVDLAYEDLIDLMLAGTEVDLVFGVAANAANTTVPDTGWTPPATGSGYKGKAIITKVDLTSANKQKASIAVEFKGRGALLKN